VLRLPTLLRSGYLAALPSPVVLFVHPWEFVDLRREKLRLDCRFKTGDTALQCVKEILSSYRQAGAQFAKLRDIA
jgi:hypothetical protein